MSASRKLQATIDVTLKKVDEGIDEFQQVWRKVEESQNQNQREKNQMDLKKEIKKLQRFREDIMKWINGTEVKDKGKLTDARRKIEVEMERFKEFERESKTKPFSFIGLQAQDKVDPAEQKRMETRSQLESYVDQLKQQNDEYTAEMEKIMGEGGREKAGKKRKSKGSKLSSAESTRVAELKLWIARHQWHQAKLEQLIRKLDNEEEVDYDELEITEQALDYYLEEHENPDYYHDEELYTNHNLDDNRINAYTKPIDVDGTDNGDGEPTDTQESQESSDEDKQPKKPVKEVPLSAGAKAMQKALAAKAAGYQPPCKTPPRPTLPVLPSISPPAPPSPPAVPQYPPPPLLDDASQIDKKEVESVKVSEKVATPTNATVSSPAPSPPLASMPPPGLKAPVVEDEPLEVEERHDDTTPLSTTTATPVEPGLAVLLRSYENRPMPDDLCCSEGNYIPANPIPSSAARKSPYPQQPVNDTESMFQKLSFDTLMFVFYYRPGSYAQYLAARELKRMSWRFHSRYGTWFKRHSEPSVVNPKFEYGTYVYFDCYADEWAQKIKKDFQFDYCHLEDELPVAPRREDNRH